MPISSHRLLFKHWRLLGRVLLRDLASRHAGSILGRGWIVLSPLLILALQAVVCLFIFRVQPGELTPAQYVLTMLSGLAPFLMTAEALALSVTSVQASRAIMSNTVFPIDLVPPKAVLSGLGTLLTGHLLAAGAGVLLGHLPWTLLLLPVVWVLHLLALFGLAWLLSLVHLVFRDLQQVLGVLLMMLMIASPIAYTPSMVPPRLRLLLVLNPFAYLVTTYQKILVLGEAPNLAEIAVIGLGSLLTFRVGSWFFSTAKGVLTDYA